MRRSLAAVCAGLLSAALAAGCGTAQRNATPGTGSSGVPAAVTRQPGGQVPAGFRAASVTFVSARDSFVLGTSRCAHAPCTAIVRTRDRGASWRRLAAPAVPLAAPGVRRTAVWGIRFASPRQGFVFGNGLWTTTDGGERWSVAASPGGSIMSLEIIDGQVLAVTMHRESPSRATWALLRRPLAGGAWTRLVRRATAIGSIATQARVAAIIVGSSVLVTGDGGRTSIRRTLPCKAGALPAPTSVAVEAPKGLALLCTGEGFTGHTIKTVYVSGNLGVTWKLAGHPSSLGGGGVIAASAPGHLTIATASAGSWLFYSANDGKTWRTVLSYPDGGQGWNDLGFTTASDGVVIHGHPYFGNGIGRLLLTGNGGLTWHRVTFAAR